MHTSLLDDNRAVEPPESIPNSEVKRSIADGSVGLPHVRVGHRQALIPKPRSLMRSGFFFACKKFLASNFYTVFTDRVYSGQPSVA